MSADLRDFFGRTFVINLRERRGRLRLTKRGLARIGMPFAPGRVERFEAIRPAEADGFPSIGSRGCYESHLAVLRRARELGLPNVLVMEDDLSVDPRFLEQGQALLAALQREPWAFAYFGHRLDGEPSPTVRLEPYTGDIVTAHFYAVNAAALDRLIAFLEAARRREPGHPLGGPMYPDGALSFFRAENPDLLTLVARPSLGHQRRSRSDLQPSWFDGIPGVRAVAETARTLLESLRAVR